MEDYRYSIDLPDNFQEDDGLLFLAKKLLKEGYIRKIKGDSPELQRLYLGKTYTRYDISVNKLEPTGFEVE